jgi:hypothetical protein
LELALKREASEALQNDELLARLQRGPDEQSEALRYGDVVQLQHLDSGLFVAMHQTPAPLNPNCRKVTLREGSLSAQFCILPRFKVRSIGSLVYADDQIIFQSVKYEALLLGATDPTAGSLGATRRQGADLMAVNYCKPVPSLRLRVPLALQREAKAEVNGSLEIRCFTIKLYGRPPRGMLVTGLHHFRLYHPEAASYMQASSDPDKGEVLDATGDEGDPLRLSRRGGIPAHVPYLKTIVYAADCNNPKNHSAKGVWCFESLDRATCSEVRWRTMPVRIRHVPSGKYLSVDSLHPALNLVKDTSGTLYDAALVWDTDALIEDGAFASASSMIFYLSPTDVSGDTVRVRSRLRPRADFCFRLEAQASPTVGFAGFSGDRVDDAHRAHGQARHALLYRAEGAKAAH